MMKKFQKWEYPVSIERKPLTGYIGYGMNDNIY